MASLSQGRTAAAQCGLFTHKSVPVIFEPPCIKHGRNLAIKMEAQYTFKVSVSLSRTTQFHNTDHNLNVRAVCTKHEGKCDSVMLLQDSFEIYRRHKPEFGATIHVKLGESQTRLDVVENTKICNH